MDKKNTLSIIIPAKNEEKFLSKTLRVLKSQKNIGNMEIIVAISPETNDKTREIAKKYGCKIVNGGRLATGRNNGSKKASHDILFFLDADTYPVKEDFIFKALKEIHSKELDVAGTLLLPEYKGKGIKKIIYEKIYQIENFILKKRENSLKPKMQSAMFLTKDSFESVSGFREGIWGEDSELAERAVNQGHSFGILKTPGKVKNSVRRFENEGFLKTLLKVLYLNAKAELFGYDSLKGVHDHFYKLS